MPCFRQFLVLTVHLSALSYVNATLDFPPFDWFHPQDITEEEKQPEHSKGQLVQDSPFGEDNGQELMDFGQQHPKGQEIEEFSFGHKPHHEKGQEIEEINFAHKPEHEKGQEIEEINFGHKPEHEKGQEIEEINFGHKPEHLKGQEIEEINFGHKPEHDKGQEIQEINFGHKPEHLKGQEIEEINFGHKPEHEKGQEIEEINFGHKPEHEKGQEIEEINFGHKPHHEKGQEIEEINFGHKPEHEKGQEIEEINFGHKPHHEKGQEIEEINFGHKPEHEKGQEVEEINFGHKPEHEKGQEIEEINFGHKPEHEKGQEIEEINFGHKPEHEKGQEIEEINFGHKPHHEKGQEIEEINFGHKPEHEKGQEIEEINFGHKPEHEKGQEIEEINFGHKPEHEKGQEIEEINFGHIPEHEKGQEIEEINFGHKPEHEKGQEIEEINFGHKPEHEKGQEIEEINFGHKPEHEKGQEIEEINFGHKPHHEKGQEIEEINFGHIPEHEKGQETEEFSFGHKPEHEKGQEIEEINFGQKPEHEKGQEVEEINFGHKPEHEKGQEIEEINFGHKPQHEKGQEVEEINFGHKPQHEKGPEAEEINFGHKPEHEKGQQIEEINFGHKPEHLKGQEIEEINFGHKSEHEKGQEIEEINFGHIPEHEKGQEIEEINFGHKPEHQKGQEVEEFSFGHKPQHEKGQEVEEINFGHKPEHEKGQEVEEINFGPKPHHEKEQEVEEINFGHKPEHEKGQETEEFSFGHKPHHEKGQEIKEINFGQKPEHEKEQEVEEINFGHKPHHEKGQEIEEINFGQKPEHEKGQEVEEINFGHKPEHEKGQEIEEFSFGHKPHQEKGQEIKEINFDHKPHHEKGQEVEEIHFGHEPEHPIAQEVEEIFFGREPKLEGMHDLKKNQGKKQENIEESKLLENPNGEEGHWFDIFLPSVTENGCADKPSVPPNSVLKCESSRMCELICQPGFRFSENTPKVEFLCDGNKWISFVNIIPDCNPVCEPPCQNNGICIAPNQCSCPKNFDGAKCQFGHTPCSNHPPISQNSYANCNSSNCVVKCFDNYSFPDGSTTADLVCHQGQWTWTRTDLSSLSECRPSCEPPCINGGSCLDFNKCQCPRRYVGSQCQYELSACDAKKLNFNGYYTCRGENDKVTCTLSCPEGHDADSTLAEEYVCYYSSGKFYPEPVPKCLYDKHAEIVKFTSSSHTIHEGVGGFTSNQIPQSSASKAECSSWRRSHYKNFDGHVFSFDGGCPYILAGDVVGNTFRVVTENLNCECSRSLKIYYEEQEYKLHYNGKTPVLSVNGESADIPNRFTGISIEEKENQILVSLQDIDVTVNLNSEDHVSVTVHENMWNKTGGLCGNFNNNPGDDFYTSDGSPAWNLEIFLQSWMDDVYCESVPNTKTNCTDDAAADYCNKIFADVHFEKCFSEEVFEVYKKACTWDMCRCGKSCACETVSEFVRNCKNVLVSEGKLDTTSDWRQIADCPLNCPPGKVYSSCGPSLETTCGSFGVSGGLMKLSECVEGCFCPDGLVQFNGSCIKKDYCPCKWRNQFYNKGETVAKDCNSCTCQNGEWVCTSLKCSSRCSVVGNTHYRTFDGKRYDLSGQCSYYLLKSEDYTIESESLPCEENTVNEIFHSYISKYSSCTKAVTIRHKTDEIKLKKNMEVSLNGADVPVLPVEANGVIIRQASLYMIVKLPDDTEIWWDGNTNVYIDLPGSHRNPTGGLCGTFNNNQKDDFKTSEGDIEQTTEHFAWKWKTDETCSEVTDPSKPHPCDSNSNFKAIAEKHCQKLKGNIFKECHPYVDVEPFYKNCLYDVCSCQRDIKRCFCPIFADYASECIRQNVEMSWRSEMRECGLHCPQGQIYQAFGDSCARSCHDISIMKGRCDKKYSEGCGCPDGLVLDSFGRCIPTLQCSCFHQGFKYKPNHELVMESENGHQFCTCQNALWSCRPATPLEIARDYENSDYKCDEAAHEVYTTCKPAEPKTCKNMHEKAKHSTRICFPGCVCKKGFVWDSVGKACVNASECPCHHGGRSYADGEKIQQDCNSCVCKNGMWSCTERECASVCSTWGDSHFKTFDGKIYDFQGSCDFVLASGVISEYETFFVGLQIVPCGSTGISCPKSVTVKVGSPEKEEKVVFRVSDKFSIPGGLERILIREVGLFVFAEVFDLGLTVQWDKGTRVYVKVDSRWKNRVKGLCGNFNNDELDDFKTPSSGETSEISPVLFADSWRLQSYCPESNPIVDTCARRPHRKAWAVKKCSILHSETFEPCHSEVSLEPYLERCVVDTCGCDEGGDCDCMCTAIAAYAEECTLRGVPIKWRTQEFCPLQCHDHLMYNPCVSTCPPKSCDNQFQHSALLRTCSEESCVEGCDRQHCSPGYVLADSSSDVCIPISSCKTVCLTVNNVTYLEGDLMESDDCHSWYSILRYCSHHTQVCTGKPCHEVTTSSPLLPTTSACPPDQIWDDCIVKCDHVCNHLRHKLNAELPCSHEDGCISGCRAIDLHCPSDMFLRDVHTCVQKKDCPCQSPSGVFVKPGDVLEAECEKCQCINNEFECSNVCTAAPPTFTPQPVYNFTQKYHPGTPGWEFAQEGNVTLIYYTTVAPPVLCPNSLYESLVDKFTRFSASSYLDESSTPAFAHITAQGSWIAGASNADQYLQVDLGRTEAVHAVNVAGAPGNYVTAYHLLHSLNGEKFLDIINQDGKKEVFGGPFDGQYSVKQVLRIPFEARYIRFHPISWHGQISMKVDVLGCQGNVTLTTPHPTSVPSVCSKPIGIGQNHFPKLQIIASSSKPNNGPEFIGFSNENGWQPLTNSKFEYVQIDFGDYGNFTGITTKGVSQGNELSSTTEESWVERFKIEYSHDGLSWNPVLDEFGDEMTFMGNTDSETEKKNFFKRPIHAKFLKILPVKWHKNIALRLDVMGCYKPPHFEVEATPPVVVPTPHCSTCPGAVINKEHCQCSDDKWWDGENCVNHSECPCFVGLIAYPVGSTFTTENCEECTCRLYGLPHCTPKLCPHCPDGLQKVLTPLCGCTCKPCEENSRLCPTSNICLQESSWCDGIQDCPDDELNCTAPTTKVTPTSVPCTASCPPGYEVIYKNVTAGPTEADDMLQSERVKSVKTKKSVKTYRKSKKVRKLQKLTECPPYDCVPVKETNECPPPECPLDYTIVYKKHFEELEESCPLYACEPVPEYSTCTILSKNVETFDGNQFKFEICDHVLVTHDSGLWNITMVKNCSYSSVCKTVLLINHGDHLLELHSHDSLIKVDSFPYSSDQVELLNSKVADFSLNSFGNSIIFTSNAYGFEVIFDTSGNFKIKVPSYMKGHLAGLCGLYNGHPDDDKTQPDGKLSKTTVDFGNSWFNPGGKECVETVCPIEMQTAAFEICLKLNEKPFNLCPHQMNMELCVESTCECLAGNKTEEECRCQLLSNAATKCRNTNLAGWRVEHDCPSSCAPHLVHYDCYPYACQPTCGNEECTEPAANCYSGCFCPDGLVKRGDHCIKVPECRDCVCSGMGDSTYLTFDGGLTFNGNCTYVATREKNPSGTPSFEVLISNSLCNGSDFMTCTDKLEIRVRGHLIEIIALPDSEEKVKVLIDEVREDLLKVEKLDVSWAKMSFNPESSAVEVGLPREHVDVRYFYKRFAFTISLPSHLYSGKVEGLCGSCSQNTEEMNDPEEWQTEKGENCLLEPPTTCIPTAEHQKLCFLMNDTKIFGQCLAFVDPTPFVDQCLAVMCLNGHICNSLEAYGQACRDVGVCVNWRSDDFCPFTCPSDLEYQPCNNGCQKTCDNYDEIDSVCTSTPVEGCFCPRGKILIDGICKAEKYCEYCDDEGRHYEDDLWQVDKCTNCTCKNHVVTCEKLECAPADITCDEDQRILKEENEFECCPKYKCGCKHPDECAKVEIPEELLPGMEAVINDTGCCRKIEMVYRKENCPEPKPCKQHYVQRIINTTACCPDYICEKPDNICFYEFAENSPENKTRVERGLNTEVVKEIGERWSDGPCKVCVCVERNGLAEAVCTVTECPHLHDYPNFEDYVLEEVFHPEKCCPDVIRKSCKHNGLIYGVGDSWVPDENSPCETMKCNDWGNGLLTKEFRLEVCNKDCEPGWEYQHSVGSCCGHCVQTGCLLEDKLYKEGEIWYSEDRCSKSTCIMKHGHFSISTETKTCPSIEDCPREDIYEEECCLKCRLRVEDKKICFPQPVPPESTVQLINQRIGRHGKCHNVHPIQNFTRCAGNCDSFTVYNPESWAHESVCKCCRPEEYTLLEVQLECEDGQELKKKVTTPLKCSCMPCGG